MIPNVVNTIDFVASHYKILRLDHISIQQRYWWVCFPTKAQAIRKIAIEAEIIKMAWKK